MTECIGYLQLRRDRFRLRSISFTHPRAGMHRKLFGRWLHALSLVLWSAVGTTRFAALTRIQFTY